VIRWWYWAVVSVGCMVLGAYLAPPAYGDWAALCWLAAGGGWVLFLQGVDAARRRRVALKADQVIKEAQALAEAWKRENECNCGAYGGHPHEPDCVWWNRRDLKEARRRGE
jgi:hypothetical protein